MFPIPNYQDFIFSNLPKSIVKNSKLISDYLKKENNLIIID